jgi:hypothetical protein
MMGVLYQLEALRAARKGLVQTARALVLIVDVVGADDPLPDELQTRSAKIAAYAFAHGQVDRRCKLPYIQI